MPVAINLRNQLLRKHAARDRLRRAAAFTLVEIMVTVTIISLLAAMSLPAWQSVKRKTLATSMANDLRTFAGAFDTYAHETGGWPAEVDAGVLPPEMINRLKSVAWLRVTPAGGQYNWDYKQMHAGTKYTAAIAISSTSLSPVNMDPDLLLAIDRLIDDGNLATGNFFLGADGEPVYIIAQ